MGEDPGCLGTSWESTLVPFPEVPFSVRIGLGRGRTSGLRPGPAVKFMCLSVRS